MVVAVEMCVRVEVTYTVEPGAVSVGDSMTVCVTSQGEVTVTTAVPVEVV